jgi:hypothetical protein
MAATALKAERFSRWKVLKFMGRLNRAAAELNPFLVLIAIGLTVVASTYFAVLAIKDALPPITRVSCPAAAETSPVVSPSRPLYQGGDLSSARSWSGLLGGPVSD